MQRGWDRVEAKRTHRRAHRLVSRRTNQLHMCASRHTCVIQHRQYLQTRQVVSEKLKSNIRCKVKLFKLNMVVYCGVKGCNRNARTDREHTFFRITGTPAVREKWLEFAGVTKGGKNVYICIDHFEKKYIWKRHPRRLLSKNSIPTLKSPGRVKADGPKLGKTVAKEPSASVDEDMAMNEQKENENQTNEMNDLNALEGRPQREHVRIEGETDKPMTVQVVPNLADHLLLTGPHYQQKDFKLSWVNYLGYDTSGVVIIGINEGARTVIRMRESNPTRFYKVKGVFGQATDNYFTSGKIVEKATYKSIKRATVDAICASMQASHQRKMFE